MSANSNSLPSSRWKADLLFLTHKIDPAPIFNLNSEQSQLSADQDADAVLGKEQSQDGNVWMWLSSVRLFGEKRDGMITNNHKLSSCMAGWGFIQKNKTHPVNFSRDKRNQPEWLITGFCSGVIVTQTCRAPALSCADYTRALFRSTWVKVPPSWI